jgi:hypothetical protein
MTECPSCFLEIRFGAPSASSALRTAVALYAVLIFERVSMSIPEQLSHLVIDGDAELREEFLADIEGWARVHGLVMGSGAVRISSISRIPSQSRVG